MATPQPSYDLKTDKDLSKFLLGAIRDVRKNELQSEQASVISQLADKYIKLKISRILEAKLTKRVDALIDYEAESSKLLIQNVSEE